MKLLVDCYNVYHRARHTPVAKLKKKDGTPSGALYGAIRTIESARKRFEPDEIYLCWEMGGKAARQEIYAEYKGDRAPEASFIPEDHATGLAVWAELAGAMNVVFGGCEADDLISCIARHSDHDEDVIILSSDHDMKHNLQYPKTYLQKGRAKDPVYTRQDFVDEMGFGPEHYLDVLAFTGDSSDNIEGLKGIGPKKAAEMLENHGWNFNQTCIAALHNEEKLLVMRNRKVLQPLDSVEMYQSLPHGPRGRRSADLGQFYESWEFKGLIKDLREELSGQPF